MAKKDLQFCGVQKLALYHFWQRKDSFLTSANWEWPKDSES